MKFFVTVLFATSLIASSSIFAQSAKFAAVWNDSGIIVGSGACDSTESLCPGFLDQIDADLGVTLTEIKVPNQKELLVGVSAQVGLFTATQVKGKKGSSSLAIAAAGGAVLPLACHQVTGDCTVGEPGFIVLDSRIQALEATLGGIIESCTFDIDEEDITTGSATWDLDDCTVEQEQISLALATLGANHFNFVFPDLPQGNYSIVGLFFTAAGAVARELPCPASSDFCAPGDGDANALAFAFIGKTMMTVQQVRAVKGELGGETFGPWDLIEP